MKKSLLALSLLAFVGLGLASCSPSETSETSISAPKGETGDTGQKGPTGDKGPTGETGDKGPDGADGVDGEKTYSTTVLGNEHGWIDVSVASATIGTDVTYTVHDYDATDAWQFKSLTLKSSIKPSSIVKFTLINKPPQLMLNVVLPTILGLIVISLLARDIST